MVLLETKNTCQIEVVIPQCPIITFDNIHTYVCICVYTVLRCIKSKLTASVDSVLCGCVMLFMAPVEMAVNVVTELYEISYTDIYVLDYKLKAIQSF